jgi:hypothetical protein
VDKEQARFILSSFRPDGSDSADSGFAEALKLAHEDIDLGAWLANERRFDAAFAAALAEVKLPAALCINILTGLAIERDAIPQTTDAIDAAMIQALASIQPLPTLRGKVLAAMELTAAARLTPRRWWRRAAIPMAAAAGIALACLMAWQQPPPLLAPSSALPVEFVETGFIRTFESPLFNVDEPHDNPSDLATHLKEGKLPGPCCLPRGLERAKVTGCRELVIDGKIGSLICFDDLENGVVHLIIFRREDVSGELPQNPSPDLSQHGRWTVARWVDHDKVLILLGNSTDPTKLATLF